MLITPAFIPVRALDCTENVSKLAVDAELLSRIVFRDENAMASLYDAHSKLVYSIALRVLRDASEAEDVLQDVFLRIWRDPCKFISDRGNFAGWLGVVARNRAIDVLRKRRCTESIDDDVPLKRTDNIFVTIEHKLMLERAKILIANLPRVQSEAMELAFFGGLTHVEIAAKIEVPVGTVKYRIRSALLFLEKAIRRPK